jgi:putative restriction endonuclease
MEGITFHGERVPIWNYQKGIFKPAALGLAGAALSIQTSVDSPYEDAHDPEAGHFIYKYRGTDSEHPDNVALRRAMWEQRPLPIWWLWTLASTTQCSRSTSSATILRGCSSRSPPTRWRPSMRQAIS